MSKKKNPQPMEDTSPKKNKKEYSGEHKHEFFNNTGMVINWKDFGDDNRWQMIYGMILPDGMDDIDLIKEHIVSYHDILSKRYNVDFRGWETNQRFYDNARRSMYDPSALYFLRCWLDYIVKWEGYAIWNFAHKEQLKLESGRNALRNADRVADEVLREFERMFE